MTRPFAALLSGLLFFVGGGLTVLYAATTGHPTVGLVGAFVCGFGLGQVDGVVSHKGKDNA